MKTRLLSVLILVIGCSGCQQPEKEDEKNAKSADFEKMVIIQDENTSSTIGGENHSELKVR